MNDDTQQILADQIYRGVGKAIEAQQNMRDWFARQSTVQKILVILIVAVIIGSILYGAYSRSRLNALMSFAKEPVFINDLNKLHDTKKPYQYQYANGSTVDYLPANLFQDYNNYQFTWVFWIYVNGFDPQNKPNNDWGSYRFGKYKHILSRGSSDIKDGTVHNAYPGFFLKPKDNSIACLLSTTGGSTVQLDLNNIPMNSWFQVALTLEESTLTLFMNGRLVRTLILKDKPYFLPNQNVYITNDGGFAGKLYKVSYFNNVLSPDKLMLLYREEKKEVDSHMRSLDYDKHVKREHPTSQVKLLNNIINEEDTSRSNGGSRFSDKDIF